MSSPLQSAREVLAQVAEVYREDPNVLAEVSGLQKRLEEPLRVALVGSVKAGKSTLLNALLGERAAPTDSRECTRVVTWYQHGPAPAVHRRDRDGTVKSLPARRRSDRLELDINQEELGDIERLDIKWPSDFLRDLILIDTPGSSSATDGVAEVADSFLMPDEGAAGADAVIYLLRSLHNADVQFLHALHEHSRHGISMGGSIAVLSRVDELGSGGLGTMVSVNDAIDRLQSDPALSGVCETVVPVAGLLGLGAATLRQSDFNALVALQSADHARVRQLMAAAEIFISAEDEGLPSQQERSALVSKFGLYGIRLSLAIMNGGIRDAPGLAAELTRRSGIQELRRNIDVHFLQRSEQLKAHSVVLAALRVARAHPRPTAGLAIARAEEHLADTHSFREVQLLGRVVAKRVALEATQLSELERVLGGKGTSAAARLGREDQDVSEAALLRDALDHLRRWRTLEANPLLDPETSEACEVASRSCEAIVAELSVYSEQHSRPT